jgi:Rrf2 family protein
VVSQRGPRGGYSLLVPPDRLTLLTVVQSLDDLSKSSFSNCVMGLQKCNNENPCPLHPIWSVAKDQMLAKLESATIADVAGLGDKFKSGKQRRTVLSRRMRNLFSIQNS